MLNITGNMADKIKNNLHQTGVSQFAWKIKFPEELPVETIPEDGVMLLNNKTERVRATFEFNNKENSVLLTPHREYARNTEYFFIAKYRNKKGKPKDICLAFVVTDEGALQTFDAKTSKDKLASITARIRSKAAAVAAKAQEKAASAEAASAAKSKQRPEIIDMDEDDL